jgi:hypothetical protein
LAIHCQVITSQVMAYRPDRDRSVIGQAASPGVMAGHQWLRGVIITTLSVNGRYFGRVTASVGREPARAGHEPVRRQAEARQGEGWPRPFRRPRPRRFAAVIPWWCPAVAVAAEAQLRASGRPRGILIAAAVHFKVPQAKGRYRGK